MSVPDWPTSFGSIYKLPPMVGGIQYEHTHRMIAEFIGLLIIVMAVWTQRIEPREWMRVLGWIALAAVVGQGILGGITVFEFPPLVNFHSARHAWADDLLRGCGDGAVQQPRLAAGFRSRLLESEPHAEYADSRGFGQQSASGCNCFLGAAFRHSGMKLLPALFEDCVVTAVLCWTVVAGVDSIMVRCGATSQTGPASVGLADVSARSRLRRLSHAAPLYGHNAATAVAGIMVISTVAHVACGALVLAVSAVLAIQSRRMIQIHVAEAAAHTVPHKAITA